jgi:hypothetical protein
MKVGTPEESYGRFREEKKLCPLLFLSVLLSKVAARKKQGNSGEKFNVVGGGSTGYCEKKVRRNICLILSG